MTIDEYVREAADKDIPLIDVRSVQMYDMGHIPGAISIPMKEVSPKTVPQGSYLYCVSGYHAGLAVNELEKEGVKTTDIGGIEDYTGPLEK